MSLAPIESETKINTQKMKEMKTNYLRHQLTLKAMAFFFLPENQVLVRNLEYFDSCPDITDGGGPARPPSVVIRVKNGAK